MSEAEPPNVIGIVITYLLASFASLFCLGLLIYMMATLNGDIVYDRFHKMKFDVTSDIYIVLCALFTLGCLLLSYRLYKLKAIQAPIADGKRALTTYYIIFMLGYMSRVASDFVLDQLVNGTFVEEMIYDWCPIIWDGIPILCLLIFHY